MPDDDRSATAYPAVPGTVRSDDASSADSASDRSGPWPGPPAGPDPAARRRGLVRARRLALIRAVLFGWAVPLVPAVAARIVRAVPRGRAVAHRIVRAAAVVSRRVPAVRSAERGMRRVAHRVVPRARRLADQARRLADRAGGLVARTGLPARLGPRRSRQVAVAAGVLCCLGVLAAVQAVGPSGDPAGTAAENPEGVALARPGDDTGEAAGADRSADRASRSGSGRADKSDRSGESGREDATAADPDASPPLADSAPVAGLTPIQMDNARAIVRTGRDMGMPRRGLVIGVATAMQESNLLNRASEVLPESKRYRHQGTGWDHDSVGLFQQRTSTGWGPVNRLMDPAYASARFFEALRQVPGWERMRLTEAAQAVQYSAYPEHYAKHEYSATEVVDALLPSGR
ncbi:peptidase M23 [Plantactinospora sp. WMMB334]|uniref:peptidase M23 n=1 Tax=Plantactinospora sp. WMMB334 TaxID=3404119 RepID=UPI003B930D8A